MFGKNCSSICINQSNRSNTVTINGTTYHMPPGNISISNNKVYLNGEPYDLEKETENKFSSVININITTDKNISNLQCGGSITVNGSLNNSEVNAGDSIDISGDVSSSDINAGDSITIEGDFNSGNMSAGDDINIRNYVKR